MNAAVVALGATAAGGLAWAPLGWLWLLAVPIQWTGGVLFRATQLVEGNDNPALDRIWRIQIASLGLVGIPLTLWASVTAGRVAQIFGAIGWFLLGLVFVVGILSYEKLARSRTE